jgi:hypothetical protein
MYAPDDSPRFLGNTTVCDDPQYAQEKYFSAPSTEPDLFSIWISSGIVATLFIKIVMANFGIALLHYMDPLSFHDGEYEYPKQIVGDLVMQEAREKTTIQLLRASALRGCLVWGIILHSCIVNLAFARNKNLDVEDKGGDVMCIGDGCLFDTLGFVFIGIGVVVVVAGELVRERLIFWRRGLEQKCKARDGVSSEKHQVTNTLHALGEAVTQAGAPGAVVI